jgi:hypothetical protein
MVIIVPLLLAGVFIVLRAGRGTEKAPGSEPGAFEVVDAQA